MKIRKNGNQNRVEAKVLSPHEARLILNAPQWNSEQAYRDRAILGVLFFTGCRRKEITLLRVKDFFEENGFYKLDFIIKGWTRHRVPICQELQVLINQYLKKSGHMDDKNSPLFLPIKKSMYTEIRHLSDTQIYLLWQNIQRKFESNEVVRIRHERRL